jgi:hypothetical protein
MTWLSISGDSQVKKPMKSTVCEGSGYILLYILFYKKYYIHIDYSFCTPDFDSKQAS